MTEMASWGPGDPPPPAEPRAPVVWVMFGALGIVVGSLVFGAALVSTIGMAVVGESFRGSELMAAMTYGSLGAVVLAVGWRAHRRDDPAGRASAAGLARLAPLLGGVGFVLGIAAGVWFTILGLDAAISIDRGTCSHFTGPLEPTDREACRAVARRCRRGEASSPPPMVRGVSSAASSAPEGVDMPTLPKARARVTCMIEHVDEFVR